MSRAFLSSAKGAARKVAEAPHFQEELVRFVEASRAAWPQFSVPAGAFARHLAEKMSEGTRPIPLESIHGKDLYLALACAQGLEGALLVLDRQFLNTLPSAMAHFDRSGVVADDILQTLRQRILLVTKEGRPRIADYSGRGSLKSWLRAAALHTAINLGRRGKLEVEVDDAAMLEGRASAGNIELDYMKARYRGEFKEAFRKALAELAPRDRNILRLHVVEGVGIQQIGASFGVHRATVARWVAQSRQQLLEATRRYLTHALHLKTDELESLMGLVRSQLDLSISSFLQS